MNRFLSLLNILQVTDSFFPSGAYAYSWGLETYVNEEAIRDVHGLEDFLTAYLNGIIKCCDALVVKLAFEAAKKEDMNTIFRLDRLIHSMKLAKEGREGSVHIGRELLRVISHMCESRVLKLFREGVNEERAIGHHPVVFGLIGEVLKIGREKTIIAFLYSTVSNIVSAGVRLIPLGHTDGQMVINGLKPLMVKIVKGMSSLQEEDICAFAPGIEIRAMMHEYLYTRLFRS